MNVSPILKGRQFWLELRFLSSLKLHLHPRSGQCHAEKLAQLSGLAKLLQQGPSFERVNLIRCLSFIHSQVSQSVVVVHCLCSYKVL